MRNVYYRRDLPLYTYIITYLYIHINNQHNSSESTRRRRRLRRFRCLPTRREKRCLVQPSHRKQGETEHAWHMLNLRNITNEYFRISVDRFHLPSILARFIAECACLIARRKTTLLTVVTPPNYKSHLNVRNLLQQHQYFFHPPYIGNIRIVNPNKPRKFQRFYSRGSLAIPTYSQFTNIT
jgi:hypothetical protein